MVGVVDIAIKGAANMFQQQDNTTDQLTTTANTGIPTVQFDLANDLATEHRVSLGVLIYTV